IYPHYYDGKESVGSVGVGECGEKLKYIYPHYYDGKESVGSVGVGECGEKLKYIYLRKINKPFNYIS
ncbi:MAG: hypothetical protein WBA93_12615, partial [Microcoleaceae cyanobacterium]